MSFLDFLRSRPAPEPGPPPALAIMRELNQNVVWGREGNREIFLEDWCDPDGRWYRLEYQTDQDGRSAKAFCRHNPWGGNPHSAPESHLFSSNEICLGSGTFRLADAVQRARYWTTGYSYLREHGTFPNL